MKNYYEVLGIAPGAFPQEIRKAFQARAQQIHPDHQPLDAQARANEAMVELNEAFNVLSRPDSRQKYDLLLQEEAELQSRQPSGSASSASLNDIENYLRQQMADIERRNREIMEDIERRNRQIQAEAARRSQRLQEEALRRSTALNYSASFAQDTGDLERAYQEALESRQRARDSFHALFDTLVEYLNVKREYFYFQQGKPLPGEISRQDTKIILLLGMLFVLLFCLLLCLLPFLWLH
jgi:curved DNA-binding protein CbpA